MPSNPNNKVFIHARKKTHIVMMMVCANPGRWGAMTLAKKNRWDHNDLAKVVNKLIKKGLLVKAKPSNKLFPTTHGREILKETNDRISTQQSEVFCVE